MICRLECRDDAADWIMGLAGPELSGLSEPERERVRQVFPGWFGNSGTKPEEGATQKKYPEQ